ncbi:MAG TPA: VOC family protein [Chloroflexota bacterium]|nr:VOC family protein [Chloroflexota bacterium]
MATLARLSHVAFNVPKDMFDKECDFWQNVIGLKRTHGQSGRSAFFTADPLRDHEFIIFAADAPVPENMVNHVAFDVATAAEVDELTARLREHGYNVDEPPRDRRQNKATSPSGIHLEINTPPHAYPTGYPGPTD